MPYFHNFIDYMTFYTLCLMFTHDFYFMRLYELYWYVSVDDSVIFMFSWIHSYFIPCFRTSFQDYHKTSCVFLHFERVFKHVKLFSNPIFWKPLPSKGGWMGEHALYAQIENHFNMYMNRVVFMRYTFDSHCVFNWYHNWYLFCILIFVSIYACFNFK